jgi:hypothetical protein
LVQVLALAESIEAHNPSVFKQVQRPLYTLTVQMYKTRPISLLD